MPKPTKFAHVVAWLAFAVFATQAIAQEPPAQPAAPEGSAPADATISDAPVGTLLSEPVDGAATPPPESGEPPADTRALDETLDLAKKRAVEPAHVDSTPYARFLPATVMAATLRGITIGTTLAVNNHVLDAMADG